MFSIEWKYIYKYVNLEKNVLELYKVEVWLNIEFWQILIISTEIINLQLCTRKIESV